MGSNPPIDYPRLIIADTDSTQPIFQDEEIMMGYTIDSQAFAVWPPVGGGVSQTYGTPSYRRCAAALLDALAANKARLSAAIKVLDVDLDLSKAAVALKDQAQCLRDTEANSGGFAIAEWVTNQFASRERIWAQWMRIYAGG